MKKHFTLPKLRPSGRGCGGLILGLLLSIISIPGAFAQLSGHVFRDFNGDGVRQTELPNEPGIGRVKVLAFRQGVTAPLSTMTDSEGAFSFNLPGGQKVRLEFSEFPAGSYESTPGANNGSAVQFVITPVAHADLGLLDPLSYCQEVMPALVAPSFVVGDPLAAGSNIAGMAAMVRFPYNASGQGTEPVQLANTAALGTVWGGVYHRQQKALYYAAFLKRHAGLGSLGLGGIYRTDLVSGNPSTVPYLDLGEFVKLSSPAQAAQLAKRKLPADYRIASLDSAVFGLVGKIGLGGMALSPDEQTLYAVNLYEKTLVAVSLGASLKEAEQFTAADITSTPLPKPNCQAGEARPWALEYYEGSLYVGLTCDAAVSAARGDLRAYVYRYDLATQSFINTPVISESLAYRKGWVQAGVPQSEYWESWTDQWSDLTTSELTTENDTTIYRVSRPQPILSDLGFDTDGSIILGLMDRTGHQTSRNQASTMPGKDRFSGYTGGDILRAQAYPDGTYKLESNGRSGQRVSRGVGNRQGPGGGEFYDGEKYQDPISAVPVHQETFMGSLVVVPGNDEVVAAVIEPFTIWTGGVAWFSNLNGQRAKAYEIYNLDSDTGRRYLGKANGLGSINALCEAAPIVIGNRLWVDTDKNGVQDPGEPALSGVAVGLYDDKGGLVSVMRSGEGGRYFFGGNKVKPNTTYYVVTGAEGNTPQFDKSSGVLTVDGKTYQLTKTLTDPASNKFIIENNAGKAAGIPANLNGFPVLSVQTKAAGQSMMSANAGFIAVDCFADAGADTIVCAGITTLQLKAAPTGKTWTAAPGNPAPAAVDQTGRITGLATAGAYHFVLTQNATCNDTIIVMVEALPKVQAIIESVTCTDRQTNRDGRIQLSGFAAGTQFNLSAGTTAESFIFERPRPIPADGIIVQDLANPTAASQPYVVRIYDAAGCTQDISLIQTQRDCACGDFKALCVPVTVRVIKMK